MHYFSGIRWHSADHVPCCRAWIDRQFPDCFALNFANAGRIRHAMDDGPLAVLPAPLAWWTFPGPHFTYGALPTETWDHYYVSFSGERAQRIAAQGLLGRTPPCRACVHQADSFRRTFERLLGSLAERPADNPRAVCLLEDLLLQVREQVLDAPGQSHLDGPVMDLMSAIRDNPGLAWDWSRQATSMGVSEVHFRRVFRQLAGLPPGQFRKRAALDLAARLLHTTHDATKAIGSRCGYDDVQHFTRVFRQRFGIPPAAYRREMQM